MMELIKIDNLSNGLYLSGPATKLPAGFMRRYSGVSAFSKDSIISRDGSTLILQHTGQPHSLIYFASAWYNGVTTAFYRNGVSIKSGLSGDRLSFAIMPPVAGYGDFLFVAGGGELFKTDSEGNATSWGIRTPSTSPAVADGGAGGNLDDGGGYKYAVTFFNSATGTRSNSSPIGDNAATANFVVLLHCDGAYGSTTLTNSVSGGPTFTCQNGASLRNFGHTGWGNSLGLTASTSDYAKASDDVDLYLDGDFTISFWAYLSTSLIGYFMSQADDANNYMKFIAIGTWPDCTVQFHVQASGAEVVDLTHTYTPPDLWNLYTVTRDGNDWRLFVNGTLVDSVSNANSYPNLTADFHLGRYSSSYMDGYLDEVMIAKGEALYTESFVPPSAPFGSNEIQLAGGSTSVDLTNIPQSDDSQVDIIELWRTEGDGSVYFRLTTLEDGTTSYTDDIADESLEAIELPTDNIVPYSWFDDCFGPWNGSIFWITRSEEGERGRLYYSPIGRAEAVQGFIEVTSDSDGLQRVIAYAGNLFVISSGGVFQIYGDNPYYSRQLPGLLGTNAPHTVEITPFGPMWESQDGVRIFIGGSQTKLIAYDQMASVFRGRTVENVSAFAGVIAAYARGEYFISDTSQTLALNIEKATWRNLGIGVTALSYDYTNDILCGAISGFKLVNFEKEGDVTDAGTAIAFDIKTGEIEFTPPSAIDLVRIDANANGETITAYAYPDVGGTGSQALDTTSVRRFTELAMNRKMCNRLSLRATGSIVDSVEIFGFEVYHTPIVLIVNIDNQTITIPGRLSGDNATLTFEDFDGTLLQHSYIFERLFYDLYTISQNITTTLYLVGESNISLGNINNAARGQSEINIQKKGRFQKLTLAGTMSSMQFYRLELTAKATKAY